VVQINAIKLHLFPPSIKVKFRKTKP